MQENKIYINKRKMNRLNDRTTERPNDQTTKWPTDRPVTWSWVIYIFLYWQCWIYTLHGDVIMSYRVWTCPILFEQPTNPNWLSWVKGVFFVIISHHLTQFLWRFESYPSVLWNIYEFWNFKLLFSHCRWFVCLYAK